MLSYYATAMQMEYTQHNYVLVRDIGETSDENVVNCKALINSD